MKAAMTKPASPASATLTELRAAPLLLSMVGLTVGATVVGVPSAPVVVVGVLKMDDEMVPAPVPVGA